MFNQYNKEKSHGRTDRKSDFLTAQEAKLFLSLGDHTQQMDFIAKRGASCLTSNIPDIGYSLFTLILGCNREGCAPLVEKILELYKKEIASIPIPELMPFIADLIHGGSCATVLMISKYINLDFTYIDKKTKKTLLHLFCEHVVYDGMMPSENELLPLLLTESNIQAQDIHGDTALHIAASKLSRKLIKELKNAGADINIKNLCGQIPLHLATASENLCFTFPVDITDYLIPLIDKNPTTLDNSHALRLTERDIIDQMNVKDKHGFTPASILSAQPTAEFLRLFPDNNGLAEKLLAEGKQTLLIALENGSPLSKEFSVYLENMIAFISDKLPIEHEEKEKFRLIVGESHGNPNCTIAMLLIVCACHKLGIKNILTELDEERWNGWITVKNVSLNEQCGLVLAPMLAEQLGLKKHLVDSAARFSDGERILGIVIPDDDSMNSRNLTMLKHASAIPGPQVLLVGADHIPGLMVRKNNDIAINITDNYRVRKPFEDLYNSKNIVYDKSMEFNLNPHTIGLIKMEYILEMVQHCFNLSSTKFPSLAEPLPQKACRL